MTTRDDGDQLRSTLTEVGRRLRRRRRRQRRTLTEVGDATGLSASFISQLERGISRPSMETLHNVAIELGTTAQQLLAVAGDSDVAIVRSDEGVAHGVDNGTGVVRALVKGERALHPLEFNGSPTEFGIYFEHDGAEFLYVVCGDIEVDIEGRDRFALSDGDSVYWEGGVRHRWRQIGDDPARVLLVLVNSD